MSAMPSNIILINTTMLDRFKADLPLTDRDLEKEKKEAKEKERKKKYNLPENPLDDFYERS
tara:strand:- start:2723 stop:2905 length:183 start_codon:yes stop_codon:yes gene_type:complete